MKERPILFSGAMVRAILDGRKTQTRRVCNGQPGELWTGSVVEDGNIFMTQTCHPARMPMICPYGAPGDRLWVRETFYESGYHYASHPEDDEYRAWAGFGHRAGDGNLFYAANGRPEVRGKNDWCVDVGPREADKKFIPDQGNRFWKKRPSIFMPRWASRITLEITGVRVERVQEISNEDAWDEGCRLFDDREYWKNDYIGAVVLADTPRDEFQGLWNSINAKRGFSWESNPWVWVVEFKRIKP